jgi:hypothetical protein
MKTPTRLLAALGLALGLSLPALAQTTMRISISVGQNPH